VTASREERLARWERRATPWIVVAGVVGVATVLSVAPSPRQVESSTVASIDRLPGGPVGGPISNGAAPRLVAGGAFGVERAAGVDDVPYAPAAVDEFRDVGAVAGAVGYAPAAKVETVSGPFLDDGTLLKPVSVNTTVPDAKDLLRKHKVRPGETLASIARKYDVERVVVAEQEDLSERDAEHLIEECKAAGLGLTFLPKHYGLLGPGIELNRLAELPVLDFRFSDPPRSTLAMKRSLDLAVSGVMLAALSPLLAVIAVLNSALSLYYYLRVIVWMYFRKATAESRVSDDWGVRVVLIASVLAVLWLGMGPGGRVPGIETVLAWTSDSLERIVSLR